MPYSTVEGLKKIVRESIDNAIKDKSKLPVEVQIMNGMSSPNIRRFLNNLCSYAPCKYLEIGVWSGSTFIPAQFGNNVDAVGIDNFSQFQEQNPREQLNQNLLKYGSSLKTYRFIDGDCFFVFKDVNHEANIFFFDGSHDEHSTRTAIEIYGKKCAKPFILVVDDLELTESVRIGLSKALMAFNVYDSWELKKDDGFHMGIYVCVLEPK